MDRLKIWTIVGAPVEILYDDITNITELKIMFCDCCVTRYVATTSFDSGIRIDTKNGCFGVMIAPQETSEFYRQLMVATRNCTHACPWLPTFVEGRVDQSEHSQPLLQHPYLTQPIPIYTSEVPPLLDPTTNTHYLPSVSSPYVTQPSAPQLYPNTAI